MKRSDDVILRKMIKYCGEIIEFIKKHNTESFSADIKTYRAVTLDLIQIGELANIAGNELKDKHSYIDWKGIAGLRHRLVHDYDGINDVLIWDVAKNQVPILINQLKQITL